MNPRFPSLIVAVIGQNGKQDGLLAQLGEKLRRRGLRAHRLRAWQDTPLGDCEILLIGCGRDEVEPLAKRIEDLWTRKWDSWYAAVQKRRNVSDAE